MDKSQEKDFSKFYIFLIGMCICIILSIGAGALLGSADLSFKDIVDVFKLKLFGIKDSELKNSSIFIVWNLRLPRALLAIAAGGGLAICGAAMQSITQNVLADPYILGISSGASAAVSFAFFLGLPIALLQWGLPLFAFGGALVSLIFVYGLGASGRSSSSTRLVLAGIAVSIVLGAFTQLFMILSPSDRIIKGLLSWMMGSLAGARWDNLFVPTIGVLICSLIFLFLSGAFNVISLGDETAISLGVNIHKIKKTTIILTALITGILVSSCGIIGFVGFVIPHIIRLLIGSDHRKLFPLCFLMGGLFLIWMDILARTVLAPQEVPIGIFTSLCGCPFFIWLLKRQMK